MENLKFVIGIGSQRAGSTLLYHILNDCSPIYMNPIKELHYFDTLFQVRSQHTLRRFSQRQLNNGLDHIVNSKEHSFIDKRYKNFLRTSFILATKPIDKIEYLDLYRPCVADHKVLGEVTPEYMILPKEGVREIAKVVGCNAKIVLLARNPVKRFISAFKLLKFYEGNAEHYEIGDFEEDMLATIKSNGEWMRVQDEFNDYEKALIKYNQEFSDILFLSYDELFGNVEKAVSKFSDFLGEEFNENKYKSIISEKVNSLTKTVPISENTMSLLSARYSAQQLFLDKSFGNNCCLS